MCDLIGWLPDPASVHSSAGRSPHHADRAGVRVEGAGGGAAARRAVVDGEAAADGLAPSYVYALHNRFSQVMADAVHDGIVPRNPCSRRTAPHAGEQRPYVASTEQVWALHDAFPEHLAPAVLLGAFVGLRTAEVCGLRIGDVDFMRGVVSPVQQWPGKPLKSDKSQTPIPIPQELALQLSASVARWGSPYVVTDGLGGCASP